MVDKFKMHNFLKLVDEWVKYLEYAKLEAENKNLRESKTVPQEAYTKMHSEKIQLEAENASLRDAIEGLLYAIHFNDDSAPHPMEEMEARAKQALAQLEARDETDN